MTKAELSESIRQFAMKWQNRGKEDEDDRSFWIDLFQKVLDVEDATDKIDFQKKVIVNSATKKIDLYIPDTKVIIEQKSNTKRLDEKILQGDGEKLTPYEQALRYNNHLPHSEKARWIVTSNFKEIWIYDMEKSDREREAIKIQLNELGDKHSLLSFLVKENVKEIAEEVAVSVQAGDIVGLIYDAFLEEYGENPTEEDLHELNKLCVRLVFCLYAEDAGLFENNAFHDYLEAWNVENMNSALEKLFAVLDTPIEKRRIFLDDRLKMFPYVNGELFRGTVEIPPITEKIKKLLLDNASRDFDWSKISPTIFGSVFESTLNPEKRRSSGMHYTSVENIHKVIDPLFFDDLKEEFRKIIEETKVPKVRISKLYQFQEKIAELKFLDPACGSGNFLTETYLSLRTLENQILKAIVDADQKQTSGQIGFGNIFEGVNPIKVSINQFYGIEINDFAVTVARTAMWIAENQMMQKTSEILLMDLDFLPLKTYTNIVEANALKIDWNDVISNQECNYIMGNPPFIGGRLMAQGSIQKKEIQMIFSNLEKGEVQDLDYVTCWYKIAAEYIQKTKCECCFVSTNSISQGVQVPILWKVLLEQYGIHINFAHQTFRWNSESINQAAVQCVIIGFSTSNRKEKYIFSSNYEQKTRVENINPYLNNGKNVLVVSRKTPLCNVPKMSFGNQPRDGGEFVIKEEEKKYILSREPELDKWIKEYIGAEEFIKNRKRWCLWLKNATPTDIKKSKILYEKVGRVKEFRLNSKAKTTNGYARVPHLFAQITQPDGADYLLIPRVSSERRNYIPIGFMNASIISSDAVQIVPNASLYHFGILTSNVHMAWMKTVAGRLKSDYRYSKEIVYNTFPWPKTKPEQIEKIRKAAQGILDSRKLYTEASMADLYDPLLMPKELRNAHIQNDKAVMQAYGFDIKTTTAESCVAKLMQMYQELAEDNR